MPALPRAAQESAQEDGREQPAGAPSVGPGALPQALLAAPVIALGGSVRLEADFGTERVSAIGPAPAGER